MVNSKEINDIKNIIISYKSCKFTTDAGCVLEAKFGKLVLSIPNTSTTVMIVIKTKKISGNGKITINGKLYIVQSNIGELQISSNDKFLDIQRPQDSIGEISILGLTIYHDDEGEILNKKWKNLIAKCGEYKSIRMIENRLYASTGAVFEDGSIIKHIETIPPNMSYLDNGILKFSGACEIIDIVINDKYLQNLSNISFNEFSHREAPTPLTAKPTPLVSNSLITIPIKNVMPYVTSTPKTEFSTLLYDSIAAKEFDLTRHGMTRNKTSKFLKSNGKDYLILKKGGSYTFPVSFIKSNNNYTIVITSKKLNGNGRLQIGLVNNGTTKYPSDIFIVDDSEIDRFIKIKTDSVDGMPRFSVSMPDTSIGEILIKSIKIYSGSINGLPTWETVPSIMFDTVSIFSDEIMEDLVSVRVRNRNAAILEVQTNDFNSYPEVFGYLEATNFKSKLWLSRTLGMFPNIKPVRLGISSYIEYHQPDVILTSLNTLKVFDRIWLEEYQNILNKEQITLLNKTQTILTPSLINSIELQNLFPEKNIKLCSLTYPCNLQKRTNDKYAVYFEDDIKHTNLILRSWKPDYPKLLVIGSNMKLVSNMKHISEYETPTTLLNIVANASMLIELSINNHFINGISDMCAFFGIPVCTNNHQYLMKKGYTVVRPSVENIQTSIENILNTNVELNSVQIENNFVKNNMLTLLGK